MEAALPALLRACERRARETTELWNERVGFDVIKAGTARPYLVILWLGGGEINQNVAQDAEIVLGIKIVANTFAQSMTGAGRISELFNDTDKGSAKQLDGGDFWWVQNSLQEGIIHLREKVDGADVYHEGHRFRFRMEAK